MQRVHEAQGTTDGHGNTAQHSERESAFESATPPLRRPAGECAGVRADRTSQDVSGRCAHQQQMEGPFVHGTICVLLCVCTQ
jgi:hypothetical protein